MLYFTVQPGFESALESELAAAFPEGRFRESLPGWRVLEPGGPEPESLGQMIFARSWGLVLCDDPWKTPAPRERFFGDRFVLQCWHRRADLPGAREKRPVLLDVELRERQLREELMQAGLPLLPEALPRAHGTPVISHIRVAPGRWLWGWHRHGRGRLPHAGGEYPWPEHEVPSRAYLKCQEAIELSEAPLGEGEQAVELGAAPGGSLLALLERGLDVTAIDPAGIAPEVAEAARLLGRRLVHLQARAGSALPEGLPERVDWLFSDMNVEPATLFGIVGSWLPNLRERGLRGLLLTIKLTEPALVYGLGQLRHRLQQGWGLAEARLRQLSQNRREVLFYGTLPPLSSSSTSALSRSSARSQCLEISAR